LLPLTSIAERTSPDLPPVLKPYETLIEQCAEYETLIRHWEPVFTAGFADSAASTWAAVVNDPETILEGDSEFIVTDKEVGREVLCIDKHEQWEGGGVAGSAPEEESRLPRDLAEVLSPPPPAPEVSTDP
jgi:hypothetical protein